MTRRQRHHDTPADHDDGPGDPGGIRSAMASVHGQMIEHIATLGLAVRKRLIAPPRRDTANAHSFARIRSSDLPEYAARMSAAAMHDIALVAQMLAAGADDAENLHAEGPPAPRAPASARAARQAAARAEIAPPRRASSFERRMQDISDAMDRGMAAEAVSEPDRPDFIAFERAVLARLKDAGLELELEALDKDAPPAAAPGDGGAQTQEDEEDAENEAREDEDDSGGGEKTDSFPGRRLQG